MKRLSGAPNEGNCTQIVILVNSLNAAGGSLMLTVPEIYTPGMEYDIVVELIARKDKADGDLR